MSTKHWNYGEKDLVLSSLKGLVAATPSLALLESSKVVLKTANLHQNDKITLISGGGSGHEPLHAGFVGSNLLDVAVAGSVFASPSTKQIYAGIKSTPSSKGTLIIVKNYTGDILHFGLAGERAKSDPSISAPVELVIVDDDVAVGKQKNGLVGRRGLAGTMLVHKICGGEATGHSLKHVANLARNVAKNLVTVGASLDHCSVPGRAEDEAAEGVAANTVEIGLGIHNEPGVKKVSPLPSIDSLVSGLLDLLLDASDTDRHYVDFAADDEVVLLVNDLGGTSNLELYAVVDAVVSGLAVRAIKPARIYVGDFVTSLNAPGFSITLLNVSQVDSFTSTQILHLLDLPTDAPGWKIKTYDASHDLAGRLIHSDEIADHEVQSSLRVDGASFERVLRAGLANMLSQEAKITHYDTIAGDGDCGETLAAGAHGILAALDKKTLQVQDPVWSLSQITNIVEDSMGGTSGGLYSIFLSALVEALSSASATELSVDLLALSLKSALNSLYVYTKARTGDRTLIDTLAPFVETLYKTKSLDQAVEAAAKGTKSTAQLLAKFGRASYVAKEEFEKQEDGIPDPGAVGLYALLEGFVSAKS
ncbi:hypothetical protein BABINDRAFT_163125 [Babjeviella inositovora NRRL Y-12698]|uniref:Dihydroxyacetone kinase n=1 Tax=Babjeviella inositovora NRRL Y-12698 TaxID=984486 RepID=A0A1E3QKW8_9ASCO|nr:uncharacterized protein BABINDRAFT_163125 [Babjeviella inositovora NRRL Y-12698]ODQ78104.1 hypothetical protein BABINDRAFT_163125 [Babjeviella inositovora NRRL Y-12698]